MNRCLKDEYAFVKTPDEYRLVRKKSLNERMDEINRDKSSVDEETRNKEESKGEKII